MDYGDIIIPCYMSLPYRLIANVSKSLNLVNMLLYLIHRSTCSNAHTQLSCNYHSYTLFRHFLFKTFIHRSFLHFTISRLSCELVDLAPSPFLPTSNCCLLFHLASGYNLRRRQFPERGCLMLLEVLQRHNHLLLLHTS